MDATATRDDEALIRNLIADLMTAICAKDVDRLMAHDAPELVTFDVKPPLQLYTGIESHQGLTRYGLYETVVERV